MKLIRPKQANPGDRIALDKEEPVDIKFHVHKFNNRPYPKDPSRVQITCCFFEFGCEIVGAMYNIPNILRRSPGKYNIAVGWHGRTYLYKHLVDEFWEIKEPFMWLREYCRAFHHDSINLKSMEKKLKQYGKVITSSEVGRFSVMSRCNDCFFEFAELHGNLLSQCPKCKKEDIWHSFFADVNGWKKQAIKVPRPLDETINEVAKYITPPAVGVFARGRKTYGRNLQPEFYIKLIALLEELGYTPIWLGEKQSTQPCPVEHIVDFSRMKESRDLEFTLAIISQLEFTVQFWTASTRLAGIMGIPYLLFESPDQIWGNGQEGFRRNLCDQGPRKLAVCHYLNVYEDNDAGIDVIRQCIRDMKEDNYETILGLVESKVAVEAMINSNTKRIGE